MSTLVSKLNVVINIYKVDLLQSRKGKAKYMYGLSNIL